MFFPGWAMSVEPNFADLEKAAIGCASLNALAATTLNEGKEKSLLIEKSKYWRLIAQVGSKTEDVREEIINYINSVSKNLKSGQVSKEQFISGLIQCEEMQRILPVVESSADET